MFFKFVIKLGYNPFSDSFNKKMKYYGFGKGNLNFSNMLLADFYFKTLPFSANNFKIYLFNFNKHLTMFCGILIIYCPTVLTNFKDFY
jgi:hypothetical protein